MKLKTKAWLIGLPTFVAMIYYDARVQVDQGVTTVGDVRFSVEIDSQWFDTYSPYAEGADVDNVKFFDPSSGSEVGGGFLVWGSNLKSTGEPRTVVLAGCLEGADASKKVVSTLVDVYERDGELRIQANPAVPSADVLARIEDAVCISEPQGLRSTPRISGVEF